MSTIEQTNQFSLAPRTFDQLMRFADLVANSGMVPRDYVGKPANIVVAVQMGFEIGLQPIQSLQNISVINGRPALWGDALPAIVYASGLCEYIEESISEDGQIATCKVKRINKPEIKQTFSMQDAKIANLLHKDNWKYYPKRMLQRRARNFALNDAFPDVLKGMPISEDVEDFAYTQSAKAEAAPQTLEQLGLTTIQKDGKLIVEGKTFGKNEMLKNLGFKYENKVWCMDLPIEPSNVIEAEKIPAKVVELEAKKEVIKTEPKKVIETKAEVVKTEAQSISLKEIEEKLNFLGLQTERKDTETQKWLCITSKNIKEFSAEIQELGFKRYESRGVALNVTNLVTTKKVEVKEEATPVVKTVVVETQAFKTPFDNSKPEVHVQDELPFD